MRKFISIMSKSSPNPMFDHLLVSSQRDDSNKLSNIGFGEEITPAMFIEVKLMHFIWSPADPIMIIFVVYVIKYGKQ